MGEQWSLAADAQSWWPAVADRPTVLSDPGRIAPPGTRCPCVTVHKPEVVIPELHHVWPKEFGGPTVPENLVYICATAHNSVHAYLRLFLAAEKILPVPLLKVALAQKGYPAYVNRYTFGLASLGYDRIQRGAL